MLWGFHSCVRRDPRNGNMDAVACRLLDFRIIKAITALAAVPTAIVLVKLVPQAIALPSPTALRREIAERRRAQDALHMV